jgi:hypothetical protein
MQALYEANMSVIEDDILRLKNLLSARQSITEAAGLQVACGMTSHEVQLRVRHA